MMLDYLELEGWRLEMPAKEIDRVFRAVAARHMTEQQFHA